MEAGRTAPLPFRRETNDKDFQHSKGRQLRYGTIVELQHDRTRMFLRVARQAAQLDADSRRVTLDQDAADQGWFRIMPFLRVHSEGAKVRIGDPIILEHVITGAKLQVDMRQRTLQGPSAGKFEVNAAIEAKPAGFKVMLYRSHKEDELAGKFIHGGQALRFLHKEADGYLTADRARAEKDLPAYISLGPQAAVSSNGMWQIAKENLLDGSAISWGEHVRIRHVGSDRVLEVKDTDESVVLTDDLQSDLALFEMMPLYPTAGKIPRESFFRLKHVQTGYTVHFKDLGTPPIGQKVAPDIDADSEYFEETQPITVTMIPNEVDVFAFAPVDPTHYEYMHQTKGITLVLRTFHDQIASGKGKTAAEIELQPVVETLEVRCEIRCTTLSGQLLHAPAHARLHLTRAALRGRKSSC